MISINTQWLGKEIVLHRFTKKPEVDKKNNRLIFKCNKGMILVTILFYIMAAIPIAIDRGDLFIESLDFFIWNLQSGIFNKDELIFILVYISIVMFFFILGTYSLKIQKNSLILTDEYIEFKRKRIRYREIKSIKKATYLNYFTIQSENDEIKVKSYISGILHLLAVLNKTQIKFMLEDVISKMEKDLGKVGIRFKYVDFEGKFYIEGSEL